MKIEMMTTSELVDQVERAVEADRQVEDAVITELEFRAECGDDLASTIGDVLMRVPGYADSGF